MDSAGTPELVQEVALLRAALATQGATLGRHEQLLHQAMESIHNLGQALQECQSQLAQLRASPPTPAVNPPRPAAPREPRLPAPERYDGNPGGCRGFIMQCELTFQLQPLAFPTDAAKVAYIITLLTDRALAWATAVWEEQTRVCQRYVWFTEELRRIFDHPVGGREAASRLLRIKQGTRSAADYAVEFRTLAVESRWDSAALRATFQHGLSEHLKDELATHETPGELEDLIEIAVRADNRHRERQRDRRNTLTYLPEPRTRPSPTETQPRNSGSSTHGWEEPMQLGHTHISAEERDRRMREHCCLYCGTPGHFRSVCPELGKARAPTGRGGR